MASTISESDQLIFFVSQVEVTFTCQHEPTFTGVNALWGCASKPQIDTETEVTLHITDGPPFQMLCDGEVVATFDSEDELLPQFEAELYELIQTWHAAYTVLHAALVQTGGKAVLVTGPSNAGKSTLSLQAVRSGWQYHSDELVLTDGMRLWGVARAIQFDRLPKGEKLEPYYSICDSKACCWIDPEFGPVYQPVYPVPTEPQSTQLPDVTNLLVAVVSTEAPFRVDPMSSIDALKALHEACFGTPQHDLGALAGDAYRLEWDDPIEAMNAIACIARPGP